MIIGIPKEIKNGENRVGITPAGVATLTKAGHLVLVESGAGLGSGFNDEAYAAQGAQIVSSAKDVWDAEMVMKVKEPIASEYGYFRKDLTLFCYLHLASEPALTDALLNSGVTSIAFETIQTDNGALPLLAPMSEVAGRMATQVGARLLEKSNGGKGVLLAGVPGVDAGKVTVVGGGIVGTNAAKIALGMGAQVTILDINPARLRYIDDVFQGRIQTRMSNTYNIARAAESADLLIGAVLIPGAKAPHLVTEDMVKSMEAGSVIVDVAIDQGGCVETADHVTTHSQPTYERHGVVHYSVGNMPGAVARTSTLALTNVTIPYAAEIASKGYRRAAKESIPLAKGFNTVDSCVTCKPVADSLSLEYVELTHKLPTLSVVS